MDILEQQLAEEYITVMDYMKVSRFDGVVGPI